MKVYFVRHGESEGNIRGVHSGWGAFELTQRGREQAEATGKALPFDRIIVSDLVRTQQTAAIALPERIADFELRGDIREYNTRWMVGRRYVDLAAEYGAKYTDCRKTGDFAPMGAESTAQFLQRVGGFVQYLEEIERENGQDAPLNIAVFTHAGVLRCIGDRILGVPYQENRLHCENCSVSVFECKNGAWKARVWNWTPGEDALAPERL